MGGVQRDSNWKHHDRRGKGGKTSGVSRLALICSCETRGAESESSCRRKNICLKSQQERRERREQEERKKDTESGRKRETKEKAEDLRGQLQSELRMKRHVDTAALLLSLRTKKNNTARLTSLTLSAFVV